MARPINGQSWQVYFGNNQPRPDTVWPEPPPWRQFKANADRQLERGEFTDNSPNYFATKKIIDLVNVAIHLRRPLIVTGQPGTGKSTLASAIAYELVLGSVLTWPITSRSTLIDALYRYDAIARLQASNLKRNDLTSKNIGNFVTLGSVGTAFLPWDRPRVLLIDEIDKSDIDLPNELLNIIETGKYEIPELVRAPNPETTVRTADQGKWATIKGGIVETHHFPIIIITSNNERQLPPAFHRRCIPLEIQPPSEEELAIIIERRFGQLLPNEKDRSMRLALVQAFVQRRKQETYIATDQLLHAYELIRRGALNIEDINASRGDVTTAILRNPNAE